MDVVHRNQLYRRITDVRKSLQLLQQCQQGGYSVSDYSQDFHRLSSRNNLSETEEQLISHFMGGLKGKLQEKLTLQPQQTSMDTIKVAE